MSWPAICPRLGTSSGLHCFSTCVAGFILLRETTIIESVHECGRGLAAPRVGDQLRKLGGVDRRQADEDGGEAVVVRLGEELLRVGGQEYLLLIFVLDA